MNSAINILELSRSLEKIKFYNREENINFNNLIKKIEETNKEYISNNYNKLDELKNIINNKFNTIKTNHYNNEIILNKNINITLETSKKVDNIFSNINTNIKW